MAAALFQHYAEEYGLDVRVESAGLGAFTGDPATDHTHEVLKEMGLDVSNHRSRFLRPELAEEFDLILVMTHQHKAELLRTQPYLEDKVFLLKEFAQLNGLLQQEPVEEEEKVYGISDPFGQSLQVYQEARDEIAAAIKMIVERWRELEVNE